MAKLLLGKDVAASINERLKAETELLVAGGIHPTLAIVRVGENPSDLSYERGAEKRAQTIGVAVKKCVLPEDASKDDVIGCLHALNADDSVHGVLLFQPLPKTLKPFSVEIRNALDPKKDVDCMTDLSAAGVFTGRDNLGFPPCTPKACIEILDYYGISLRGKNVVVLGRSNVVGKPLALMLMARDATVTVCHTKTIDIPRIAKRADILISSVGVLHFLTKDCVREGQILIDVSTNWDAEKLNARGERGAIAGDACFDDVEPIVEAITPVPGGVGAVTTSVLIGHVVEAASRGLHA